MMRIGASIILGFVLILLQSFIVMKFNHYSSIQFAKPHYIVTVWILNFFFSYSILTQIYNWMETNHLLNSASEESESLEE